MTFKKKKMDNLNKSHNLLKGLEHPLKHFSTFDHL